MGGRRPGMSGGAGGWARRRAGWGVLLIAGVLSASPAASAPQAPDAPAADPSAAALRAAAGSGAVDLVLDILRAHPEAIDGTDALGCTPLHWAADANHAEVVTVLLDAHATVDARNNIGQTPLYWAAFDGHADMVRLLLAYHADPGIMARDGSSPLSVASAGLDGWRNPAVLELLGGTVGSTAAP
jgi:ankyrin repeat protein